MRWPLVLQSRSGFTTTPLPLNWIKETKKRPLQISISPYSWVSHCNRLDWWASSTEPCGFWLISSFIVVFCFYVFQIKTISAMLFQLQCDNSSEATSWFDSIGTIIRRLVSSQRVFLEFFECFFFFFDMSQVLCPDLRHFVTGPLLLNESFSSHSFCSTFGSKSQNGSCSTRPLAASFLPRKFIKTNYCHMQ